MSRTTDMITHYLLEFDIDPDRSEYYGDHMPLKQLKQKHQVVCVDRNCARFKDVDQIQPGDVVHVEDDDGDMCSYKIT